MLHTLKGHTGSVNQLISLQNGYLASGGQDSNIFVWDPVVGSQKQKLVGHSNVISSFVLLTNGYLVSGSYDSKIIIWNTSSGSIVYTLIGHTDNINVLLLLSNGLLSSGSKDTTVKLWNLNNGSLLLNLNQHTGSVNYLVQLETGNLASLSSDSTIKYWDLNNGNMLVNISLNPNGYQFISSNLVLLQNGNLVCTVALYGQFFQGKTNMNIYHPQTGYLIQSVASLTVGNLIVLKNNYLITFGNMGGNQGAVIIYDGYSLSSIISLSSTYIGMISLLKNGYIARAIISSYTIDILYWFLLLIF